MEKFAIDRNLNFGMEGLWVGNCGRTVLPECRRPLFWLCLVVSSFGRSLLPYHYCHFCHCHSYPTIMIGLVPCYALLIRFVYWASGIDICLCTMFHPFIPFTIHPLHRQMIIMDNETLL